MSGWVLGSLQALVNESMNRCLYFRQDGDHRCSAWEVEIRLSEVGNRRDCGPRPAIDKRRAAGNERIAQARVGPEITEDGPVVQEGTWFDMLCLRGRDQFRRPPVIDRRRVAVLIAPFQEAAPGGQHERAAPDLTTGLQLLAEHRQEELGDALRRHRRPGGRGCRERPRC